MMNLISSELLKKEITALPKQMAAVMNTTAESHSEILLMRKTINIQISFLNFIFALLGKTDFYMSQGVGNHTSNLIATFLFYVYIYIYIYVYCLNCFNKKFVHIYICL